MVADLLAEEGLVPRSSVPWSAPRLHTDGPVEGVDGLAGLRCRAYDASPEEFSRLTGVSPTRSRPHIGRSPRRRSSSLMGEIRLRSRMAGDLFAGSAPQFGRAPGRLLHAGVPGRTISTAVSGSRAATAATTGWMSVPGLSAPNYPEGLVIGTLAGSAVPGLLIPPPFIPIACGVVTDRSGTRLLVAGVLPGLVIAGLFAGCVAQRTWLDPDAIPPAPEAVSSRDEVRASRRPIPAVAPIVGAIDSISAGITSLPTPRPCAWFRRPCPPSGGGSGLGGNRRRADGRDADLVHDRLRPAIGGADDGLRWPAARSPLGSARGGCRPRALPTALTVFFVVLGRLVAESGIVVATMSMVPRAAGIEPRWLGISLAIVVETSRITPSVSFNLFAIRGRTGSTSCA